MRLLLLNEDEAALVPQALETWSRIYAGETGEDVERQRVDRFNVQRKLEEKYTTAELQDLAQAALDLMD